LTYDKPDVGGSTQGEAEDFCILPANDMNRDLPQRPQPGSVQCGVVVATRRQNIAAFGDGYSMVRRQVLQILGMVPAIAMGSCCSSKQNLAEANLAAEKFHAQFNAGDYAGIHAAADAAFQKSMSEADFITFMDAIHRKLGDHQSSAFGGFRAVTGTGGTRISQACSSEFAKGKAKETFTWLISNSHATLMGYNINSRALIIK
jgi:hypothetical protein